MEDKTYRESDGHRPRADATRGNVESISVGALFGNLAAVEQRAVGKLADALFTRSQITVDEHAPKNRRLSKSLEPRPGEPAFPACAVEPLE